MQRNALLLLAVSALVVLAGCTGALPGGTDEPTTDDMEYPDGVSETGTNLTALTQAHADALDESSFTLGVDSTQNTSMGNQSVAMTAAVSDDREQMRANVSAAGQQSEMYLTENTQYTRISAGGQTQYDASERTSDGAQFVPQSYSGATYVDQFGGETAANFTPTDVREIDGTTLIVLEADGSNVSAPEGASFADYNATMLVDEQGVIHSFEVSLESEQNGASANVSFAMNVSDVNETTVEEPSWLDEAKNQTGE
ncbi:DUF7537 family lipoprotein [Halorussus amylolyticus]|uniref:DUF7537 family lipoprotein n=1 Tax=Halorussus amylolyticus TaxID=1126242 RepID=UPI00104664A8|nr:hypothetical protein [Halorussus amylolyticus]